MPTRTLIRPDGLLEYVEAERIEDDGNGWSWRTVVVVIDAPRWACVRRVSAVDVIGKPLPGWNQAGRRVPQRAGLRGYPVGHPASAVRYLRWASAGAQLGGRPTW